MKQLCTLPIAFVFLANAIAAQEGYVKWPEEYVLEILRPLVVGDDSRQYLAGVVQNLIADELSLQRQVLTRGRIQPLSLEYRLEQFTDPPPPDARQELLSKNPPPEILPLRIERSRRIPTEQHCSNLPDDRYSLLVAVALHRNRLQLGALLCQGQDTLYQQKVESDEQELVSAVMRLMNPIRAKLTGDRYGTLRVESSPAQASVYLGEQFLGKTPLEFSYLLPGDYALTVKLAGHRTLTENVRIRVGEKIVRKHQLEKITGSGSIEIRTTPPGARIYLDADYMGVSPKRLENLPAGNYRLHLWHKQAGESFHVITLPEEGGNFTIEDRLEGFIAEKQPGFWGLSYKTWYRVTLFSSAALLGTGIALYVWRDQAQEEIFARLSGKTPTEYSAEDRAFLQQKNQEFQTRDRYATAAMVGSGLLAISAIYFYVQYLLTQEENVAHKMDLGEPRLFLGGTAETSCLGMRLQF